MAIFERKVGTMNMDDIDSEVLAVMLTHCSEYSCDGCPGVDNHCTGRVDLMQSASRHLRLRMAQIEGMKIRMYDAEKERDRLRDERLMNDRTNQSADGFGERYLRD